MKKHIKFRRTLSGIEITVRLPWFPAKRKPVSDAARRNMSAAQRRRREPR